MPNPHQPFRVFEGKGFEQNPVNHTEDCAIGSDTYGERRHRHNGEYRGVNEPADGTTHFDSDERHISSLWRSYPCVFIRTQGQKGSRFHGEICMMRISFQVSTGLDASMSSESRFHLEIETWFAP